MSDRDPKPLERNGQNLCTENSIVFALENYQASCAAGFSLMQEATNDRGAPVCVRVQANEGVIISHIKDKPHHQLVGIAVLIAEEMDVNWNLVTLVRNRPPDQPHLNPKHLSVAKLSHR